MPSTSELCCERCSRAELASGADLDGVGKTRRPASCAARWLDQRRTVTGTSGNGKALTQDKLVAWGWEPGTGVDRTQREPVPIARAGSTASSGVGPRPRCCPEIRDRKSVATRGPADWPMGWYGRCLTRVRAIARAGVPALANGGRSWPTSNDEFCYGAQCATTAVGRIRLITAASDAQ